MSEKINKVQIGIDMNEQFGNKLIKSKFLKYAEADKTDSLQKELKKAYIYNEYSNKYCHIDAEELAEFNFDDFLPTLKRIFLKRNINLVVEKTENYQKTNEINVNNEKIKLYTAQDLDNEVFLKKGAKSFFTRLNRILKSNKCSEQFYLLYSGNDLSTLILTVEQYETIQDFYKLTPNEKLYYP